MGLIRRDPFQPGAYVATTRVLYEIVERTDSLVTLENCTTGWRHTRQINDLLAAIVGVRSEFKLVKPAPACPPFPTVNP